MNEKKKKMSGKCAWMRYYWVGNDRECQYTVKFKSESKFA